MAEQINGVLADPDTNPWFETYTGRRFNVLDPTGFTIFDIAHALGNKCRYNGHCAKFYSVAEHCVTMALWARHIGLPVETQFQLLMHDGNEAYLPDVPRPMKHLLPELNAMEKAIDFRIREWCGLPHELPPQVKELDRRIIRDERVQMLIPSGNEWSTDCLAPVGVALNGFLPYEAQMRFLQAYQTIGYEYHNKPVLTYYDAGEFAQVDGSDLKGYTGPDVRMIDFRGRCAWALKRDSGELYFIHGDWDIFTRA